MLIGVNPPPSVDLSTEKPQSVVPLHPGHVGLIFLQLLYTSQLRDVSFAETHLNALAETRFLRQCGGSHKVWTDIFTSEIF